LTEEQIFATALAAQALEQSSISSSTTESPQSLPKTSNTRNEVDSTPKTAKIKKLEDELTKLRGEIHLLPDTDNGLILSTVIASQNAIIAPPPPPLLPPLPPIEQATPKLNSIRRKSPINPDDKENVENPNQHNFSTPKPLKFKPKPLTRIDINLSEIKNRSHSLKRTDSQRSPGGTPMKKKETTEKPIVTQGDFIASALKKRFKNVQQHSPDPSPKSPGSDWDENEYTYLQQTAIPGTPFVPLKSRK